ncbi:heat shock 22 kDa protein, mitochondrial-like [Papaver somniferum]|uniref:heat shock 22 kDa protein, mitochondrial-like n=1 Tax=Papaver somniferum TaxID=3469 RepID=UPI000E702094|nr:heat shock 22 kDa protein, mitochondrial-like [Papaver somniferum]
MAPFIPIIMATMSKKPITTSVVTPKVMKNKLHLFKNPNPKRSAVSFVPKCSFPLTKKNKKGSDHICDALRPSFPTHDLISSDIFVSDMEEEVKLYDKEEVKDLMMNRWSAKELKEGIELKINLPGFGKDDIKVTVDGTSLVITSLLGKEEDDVVGVGLDVNEDDMNTVIIFDLDFDDLLNLQELKAEMKNGLLKISIPKVKVEEKNVILVTIE